MVLEVELLKIKRTRGDLMTNEQEESYKKLQQENTELQNKIKHLEIEIQVLAEFREKTVSIIEKHLAQGFTEEMKRALKVSSLSRFN